MIDYEEKFFSYLKGSMNSKEKKEFEKELLNSPKLNKEFADYKNLHTILNDAQNIHINKNYSQSIITEFRKRKVSKEKSKPFRKIKYVLASTVIILVGYYLISLFKQENSLEINSLLTEFSEAELDSLKYNVEYSSEIENIEEDIARRIDSIYNYNISASLFETSEGNSLDNIFSINIAADVDEYLTENDIDLIYSQLINKEIL